MKFFLVLSFFLISEVKAAQVGQVIVEEAQVYEYPQFASKVISKFKKGDSAAVSNLPTEGFYKVRLKNGDLGWVSGNDILMSAGSLPSPSRTARAPKAPTEEASEPVGVSNGQSRWLFGYGKENLSYGGISAVFEKVNKLNQGSNIGLEYQWSNSERFFWALRLEVLFSSSGDQVISNGLIQRMNEINLPVQFGFMYSLIQSKKFRLSTGLYAGASYSYIAIEQSTSAAPGTSNKYASIAPTGSIAMQMAFKLGERFGVFGDVAYRVERTFPQVVSTLGSSTFPAFSTDYSGVLGRIGVELHF